MSHIICVGIATVDVILEVERFPREDEELRALDRRIARGGNAANSSVVLSQLGHRCDLVGVLADDEYSRVIETDLLEHRVSTRYCQRIDGAHSPTSYILLSRSAGSRTIVHHRRLSEYDDTHFAAVELGDCDWIHFEGRNVDASRRMLEHLRRHAPGRPVSIEIEKERDDIDTLWPLADILLFSRAFARGRGYRDPQSFLNNLGPDLDAILVCTWGEAGAVALDRTGRLHSSPAFPPERIVDSVGAGDTFNAGLIDGLLRGYDLEAALGAGCRLAGRKLAQHGFFNLVES